MQYQHTTSYAAPVADVYAMLVDPKFQAQRAQAGEPEHAEAKVEPGPGDGATVVVTRRLAVDLPPFVKAVAGSSVTFNERFTWPDGADPETGARTATAAAEIQAQPGEMRGTLRLEPDGDGTTVTLDAEVRVRVPIVGRKIERYLVDMLNRFMRTEHKLGEAWLAGPPKPGPAKPGPPKRGRRR